jgi:hypothetical protein
MLQMGTITQDRSKLKAQKVIGFGDYMALNLGTP